MGEDRQKRIYGERIQYGVADLVWRVCRVRAAGTRTRAGCVGEGHASPCSHAVEWQRKRPSPRSGGPDNGPGRAISAVRVHDCVAVNDCVDISGIRST